MKTSITNTTNTMSTTSAKSFNPWPYAIIGYFIIFASGIGMFITWAVHQRMDLVQKDYYESEIVFQKRIDAVSRTAAIKKDVSLSYESRRQRIALTLPVTAANLTGLIHLYRPSDARLDQEIALQLDSKGSQEIPAASLKPGLWKVRVSWKVEGEDYYYDDSIVVGSGF